MKYEVRIPPFDSPFFAQHLNSLSNETGPNYRAMCEEFYNNGYIVIDLDLSNEDLENISSDVQSILEADDAIIQDKHYQYSDSPRVFQGWKKSKNIKNLACNPKIMETLKVLYGRNPFPFSTINFTKGAQQPFHSDTIHFQTLPYGWIVGCWVALEDVDELSGPLKIIPGSHKNRNWSYQDLGIPHPDSIEDGEKTCYRAYENFIDEFIKEKNLKPKVLSVKKGQCVIWAAELLHGSTDIQDRSRTRKSQAIHYSFEGCTRYFHPMFSNVEQGKFADKWCNSKNNIMTWEQE